MPNWYMSPISGDAPSNPTATNFYMWCPSFDIIIDYARFHCYNRHIAREHFSEKCRNSTPKRLMTASIQVNCLQE